MFINHEETIKQIHKPFISHWQSPPFGSRLRGHPRNRSCSSRDVSRRGWGDAAAPPDVPVVGHVAFRRIGQKQPHTHIYIIIVWYCDIVWYTFICYIMLYYVFRNACYMIISCLYSHTYRHIFAHVVRFCGSRQGKLPQRPRHGHNFDLDGCWGPFLRRKDPRLHVTWWRSSHCPNL